MRALAAAVLAFALCVPAHAATVTVFAAASMREALDDAASAFERSSGHKVRASYGASSALARQIEEGAPAELFLCADADWMSYLVARNLVEAPPRNLLSNSLVLIAPASEPSKLRIAEGFALADALGRGRLAIADPGSVPAGKYARASLERLRVWESVRGRLAPAENVRAAMALVARGEAPFGIVYSTDALAEPRVAVVDTFPAASHPAIVYPLAVVQGAPRSAREFARFLASPEALEIFRRRGFGVP